VEIGRAADWNIASVAAKNIPAGVHDLVVTQAGTEAVDVDWVSFRGTLAGVSAGVGAAAVATH
jgi:hypothetical protein